MARYLPSAGAVALTSILSLSAAAPGQQVRFDVTDLGPVIQSFGMNEDGAVVGIFRGADGLYHGFLAEGGGIIDIGSLGAHPTFARQINAAGHIVGSSITDGGREHAFVYRDGVMTDLGTFGGDYSHANNINDAGQVVGDAATRGHGGQSGETYAFIWEGDRLVDLGTLGGEVSYAYGINGAGHVVGSSWNPERRYRPFLWTPEDGMIDLGDLGGITGIARDLNELGHVVGSSGTAGGLTHATLWRDGEIIDLGVLPEAGLEGEYGPELIETAALAINNSGQIVGYSFPGFNHVGPFFWEDGVMVNLNLLIDPASGWMIVMANDINERGQIAATARGADGQYHALLLTPVACPADFNGDGARDTSDFFEFFADFFASPPDADYNGDGGTNTADFFEFFSDFFGPPC